jgi:membrane protein implicated in regulation of membrane protease activity
MIIGLQVLFVFGIMGVIMLIGKVISTPGWVFLILFLLFAASMVYIYRKAKKQLKKMSESFSKADRNYEISIMGGMLTMRIEQNPNAPKLIEAPFSAPAEPVIDAETTEADPAQKPAHLS